MTDERTEQDGVALEKRAVRAAMRAAITMIPQTVRSQASARVCQRVMAMSPFAGARTIMMFAPLPDEVDLSDLLARCRARGVRVCAPRAGWETRVLEPAEVGGDAWELLAPTKYGIREPAPDAPGVPLDEIDLVLAPGAAFDRACHRLGRGGGFYDRFLARAELRRAFLVGVGFARQLVARVPRAEHDRPVDVVVTDDEIVARRSAWS